MQQLTVLTGNSASHLSRVITHLSQEGVDLRAHCLVDNGDSHCKLRMIVSDPGKAVEILTAQNIVAVVNEVVIIETDDKPGSLATLLGLLEAEDIRVEFTYTAATESPGVAEMVFRFSDNARALSVLEQQGVKIIGDT